MRVVILHEAVGDAARADESDVLHQAHVVAGALDELGHSHTTVALAGDVAAAVRGVLVLRPDVVFNLVESIDGCMQRVEQVPAWLETVGLPYTGSGPAATLDTGSKLSTKQRLTARGLPTPLWLTADQLRSPIEVPRGRYVIKSVWEHGSLGLDDDSVVTVDDGEVLLGQIEQRLGSLGGSAFAEAYVHGREFNLALLATRGGVETLPPAEIRFDRELLDSEVRIVGYRAKWSPGSDQDVGTPRAFDFPSSDAPLLARMDELVRSAWDVFGLGGYARVDLRVDEAGEPWIIDVNTNPCLSPDAGFAAALDCAGIAFPAAVERILAAALARRAD